MAENKLTFSADARGLEQAIETIKSANTVLKSFGKDGAQNVSELTKELNSFLKEVQDIDSVRGALSKLGTSLEDVSKIAGGMAKNVGGNLFKTIEGQADELEKKINSLQKTIEYASRKAADPSLSKDVQEGYRSLGARKEIELAGARAQDTTLGKILETLQAMRNDTNMARPPSGTGPSPAPKTVSQLPGGDDDGGDGAWKRAKQILTEQGLTPGGLFGAGRAVLGSFGAGALAVGGTLNFLHQQMRPEAIGSAQVEVMRSQLAAAREGASGDLFRQTFRDLEVGYTGQALNNERGQIGNIFRAGGAAWDWARSLGDVKFGDAYQKRVREAFETTDLELKRPMQEAQKFAYDTLTRDRPQFARVLGDQAALDSVAAGARGGLSEATTRNADYAILRSLGRAAGPQDLNYRGMVRDYVGVTEGAQTALARFGDVSGGFNQYMGMLGTAGLGSRIQGAGREAFSNYFAAKAGDYSAFGSVIDVGGAAASSAKSATELLAAATGKAEISPNIMLATTNATIAATENARAAQQDPGSLRSALEMASLRSQGLSDQQAIAAISMGTTTKTGQEYVARQVAKNRNQNFDNLSPEEREKSISRVGDTLQKDLKPIGEIQGQWVKGPGGVDLESWAKTYGVDISKYSQEEKGRLSNAMGAGDFKPESVFARAGIDSSLYKVSGISEKDAKQVQIDQENLNKTRDQGKARLEDTMLQSVKQMENMGATMKGALTESYTELSKVLYDVMDKTLKERDARVLSDRIKDAKQVAANAQNPQERAAAEAQLVELSRQKEFGPNWKEVLGLPNEAPRSSK